MKDEFLITYKVRLGSPLLATTNMIFVFAKSIANIVKNFDKKVTFELISIKSKNGTELKET